jgi:hypothetical protein
LTPKILEKKFYGNNRVYFLNQKNIPGKTPHRSLFKPKKYSRKNFANIIMGRSGLGVVGRKVGG